MLKVKEDHIQKLEVIASVILPNVYKQNQNLIQINKQNIEKVNYSLIHLTCDEKLYHPMLGLLTRFHIFSFRLVPNWQK